MIKFYRDTNRSIPPREDGTDLRKKSYGIKLEMILKEFINK